MKHIKRKFRFEQNISTEEFEADYNSINLSEEQEKLSQFKIKKGQRCFFHSSTEKTVEAFPLKVDGKTYYIPEPDPVLIYFDSAQRNYKSILENRKKALKSFDFSQAENITLDPHNIYNHFELCAVFIISLFTSVEAFMNKILPEHYVYQDKKPNRTEVYDKNQIQRYISFEVKVKRIFKEVTNKDFGKDFPLKFQHILNLKEFRDAIIHTKTSTEGYTPYDYLFKSSFTFKYEDALHSVRDFINFYQPNYIEECDCGKDF